MIHKQFGAIPAAARLEPVDEDLLAGTRAGFETVGGLLERQRVRAATAEAMRLVGEANAYISKTEPFRLKGADERERLGTILHVLAQVVTDLNTMLSPFLPHSANAVHRVLGNEGDLVPMPRLEEVDDLDGGPGYPVITGDYSDTPPWQTRPVVVGTALGQPVPVFRKFDPSGPPG
jgi:methionyl-tRNA synthetase